MVLWLLVWQLRYICLSKTNGHGALTIISLRVEYTVAKVKPTVMVLWLFSILYKEHLHRGLDPYLDNYVFF